MMMVMFWPALYRNVKAWAPSAGCRGGAATRESYQPQPGGWRGSGGENGSSSHWGRRGGGGL